MWPFRAEQTPSASRLPPPLDVATVRVPLDAAMASAGLARFPRSLRLEMMGAHPVYRMGRLERQAAHRPARDAARIEQVDAPAAQEIARRFSGAAGARWIETAERDQWTVPNGLESLAPAAPHCAGRRRRAPSCMSPRAPAKSMRDTNRSERFWNWLGAVPHWLYFTPVRADPPLWRQVVLWTSGVCDRRGGSAASGSAGCACVCAAASRMGSAGGTSPYHGWMGLAPRRGPGRFAVPAGLAGKRLAIGQSQPVASGARVCAARAGAPCGRSPAALSPPGTARRSRGCCLGTGAPPREIRMARQAGLPVLAGGAGRCRHRGHDAGLPRRHRGAACALRRGARAGCRPAGAGRGCRRQRPAATRRRLLVQPPPAARSCRCCACALTMPPKPGRISTPTTATCSAAATAAGALYRWLFNAAHTWDLGWLLRHRPAWDLALWLLSIVGLAGAVSGVVIGWRRLFRRRRRRA
ncbi:PepSY domain-containing protein [Cupriavidus basilensis]